MDEQMRTDIRESYTLTEPTVDDIGESLWDTVVGVGTLVGLGIGGLYHLIRKGKGRHRAS